MDRNFVIKYKTEFGTITTNETENEYYSLSINDTDSRFTVVMKPKKTFELVAFFAESDYVFAPGDNFYAGGYQSWSTSREYKNFDVQRRSNKLADLTKQTNHTSC